MLYITIHDDTHRWAVHLLLSCVASLGWQTVWSFHLMIRNNGAASVFLDKHRHWLHTLPPLRDFHWLGKLGNVFFNRALGGWHEWDYQRNTRQMRGAAASAVPLLRDGAENRRQQHFGKMQIVSVQVRLWWRGTSSKIKCWAWGGCRNEMKRDSRLDWGLLSFGKQDDKTRRLFNSLGTEVFILFRSSGSLNRSGLICWFHYIFTKSSTCSNLPASVDPVQMK